VEWRLLEGVPAEQVRELLKIARRRNFARNEVVFTGMILVIRCTWSARGVSLFG
jgi:hypothetical protein